MRPRTTPSVRSRIGWTVIYAAFCFLGWWHAGADGLAFAAVGGAIGMWGGQMWQGCDACEPGRGNMVWLFHDSEDKQGPTR